MLTSINYNKTSTPNSASNEPDPTSSSYNRKNPLRTTRSTTGARQNLRFSKERFGSWEKRITTDAEANRITSAIHDDDEDPDFVPQD